MPEVATLVAEPIPQSDRPEVANVMLSRSLRKRSVDIWRHELLVQRLIPAGDPEAFELIGHLAEEWEVQTPGISFRVSETASYDGLYEFRARPPTIWVVESGTTAQVLVHEFTHHLQWQKGARTAYLPQDSLGRWLWHKPTVFVPLIDKVAAVAERFYQPWAL